MALSKLLVASLLASFLLLHLVDAADHPAYAQTQGSLLQKIDCNGACAARCRLSSRPRLCHRACGTCCGRCNCVPPGTAGNQEVCPCYASLTTHGGKRYHLGDYGCFAAVFEWICYIEFKGELKNTCKRIDNEFEDFKVLTSPQRTKTSSNLEEVASEVCVTDIHVDEA